MISRLPRRPETMIEDTDWDVSVNNLGEPDLDGNVSVGIIEIYDRAEGLQRCFA